MFLIRCLLVSVFFGRPLLGTGQDLSPSSIKFAVPSVVLSESDMGFNRLIIQNHEVSDRVYRIRSLSPDIISIISDLDRTIAVRAQSEIIVPIRFVYKYGESAHSSQTATFEVSSEESMDKQLISFQLVPIEKRQWEAQLLDPVINLTTEEEFTLRLRVSNKGNQVEEFKLNVTNSTSPEIAPENFSFSLSPRKDSLIILEYSPRISSLESFQTEEFRLKLEDGQKKKKLMIATVQKVGSVISQNTSKWHELPLAIELQAYTSGLARPSLYFNIEGSMDLDKKKQLGINIRSNLLGNSSVTNNLSQIRYRNNHWTFTLGSIVKFNDFLINGNGITASYYKSDQEQQSLSVSKSRLSPLWQTDYNGAFFYFKKIKSEVRYFSNINPKTG